MNLKHALLIVIFLAACFSSKAQVKICPDGSTGTAGVVRVMADTQLTNDIKPAVVTEDEPTMQGYRIQVYAGSDKNAAQKLKNDIAMKYDVPTYMVYESPYFKVRVGDFRSRLEAQYVFHALKATYNGILLVPGKINLPDLKK